MVNKKAQEMSVTTIILIVLGIFILVILILGFTKGWGNIKDWIIPSNNVKTIADSCKIACGTDQVYSYCFEKRELKSKEETLQDVTCYSLVKKKPAYGIEICSAIDCGIQDSFGKAKEYCNAAGDIKTAETEIFYISEKLAIVNSTCGVLK